MFLPVFAAFLPLVGLLGDGGMKRVFLSYLWKMPPEELEAAAREFAASMMPAIYPEVKAMLDEHREAGHLTILLSASPHFYVKEIGRELGFDLSFGTPVETGSFFPDLENHKGEAKVCGLAKLLPSSYFKDGVLIRSRGYTDSTADLPMLAICESAVTVNPSARLTQLSDEAGWQIVRPARPWKTKAGFFAKVLKLLAGGKVRLGA